MVYRRQAAQGHGLAADLATVAVDASAACCWGNIPSALWERRSHWQGRLGPAGTSDPSAAPVRDNDIRH